MQVSFFVKNIVNSKQLKVDFILRRNYRQDKHFQEYVFFFPVV